MLLFLAGKGTKAQRKRKQGARVGESVADLLNCSTAQKQKLW